MKKTILILSSSLFTLTLIFTGCNSSSEEAKEREKLEEENRKLQQDMDDFRSEINMEIDENNARIRELRKEEFNDAIEEERAELKAQREEWADKMEEKNESLREQLRQAKYETKSDWENFKAEFKHDMKELGQALKDIGKDNVEKKE